MLAGISADIVVLIHFLWILFLVLGSLAGRRYRWVKVLHIGGMSGALFLQVFHLYCPLTYLEVWLRKQQEPSDAYQGSFIVHYVEKLVYIDLSARIIFIATCFVVLLSAVVYLRNPKRG